MKIAVVLTQWKRAHLEKQLESMARQTIHIDYLIVFQNENHVDIRDLKQKYNFIHVLSEYNTKYFGRFANLFTYPVDICCVLDDDIIPGINCIKNYCDQCIEKNAIIGGNGRNITKKPAGVDTGFRKGIQVDFVGHLWCFKKEWLHYMFGNKPYTYDTSEDMHLCFSARHFGGINSYIGEQLLRDDVCDIYLNGLANDQHSSFKITNKTNIRQEVIDHWVKTVGYKHI
jgi:hypothetical protein